MVRLNLTQLLVFKCLTYSSRHYTVPTTRTGAFVAQTPNGDAAQGRAGTIGSAHAAQSDSATTPILGCLLPRCSVTSLAANFRNLRSYRSG
jgi:hypothetical protein